MNNHPKSLAVPLIDGAGMSYHDFIARKLSTVAPVGFPVGDLPAWLFPHQSDLTRWALRRGRAAIFADTGLGKTRMELAWADAVYRHTGLPVLMLAPLAVADQTVSEGRDVGVDVVNAREQAQAGAITITNYERLHRFDASRFGAVVLDESSVIKHHAAKTFGLLREAFGRTPYRLCATATPAPNDWTELGTHAEFLGICTRQEMLSEYFIHDGGDTQSWRLKGHAQRQFWRWVSSWGAMVRKPSDLGHDDAAYALPPLKVMEHTTTSDVVPEGVLFATEAQSLSERRAARKASITGRVKQCAAIVNASSEPWIIWCDLNAEGDAMGESIPGAVEVRGSDDIDHKEGALRAFARGEIRVLITKPSIAGWGLNWQHCARMAFVGVTDSWEAYYQAMRRCWRFGQRREVEVHIFASEMEGAVVANLKRKDAAALLMGEALSRETNAAVRAEIHGARQETNAYQPAKAITAPAWLQSETA